MTLRTYRKFSPEFKSEAVCLAEESDCNFDNDEYQHQLAHGID